MFDDKIVVVTGAGRGLGAAFALSLAPLGCELILCARRKEDLNRISDAVIQKGGTAPKTVQLDLSDATSVQTAAEQISMMTRHVDIVINNGSLWLEHSDDPYAPSDVLEVVNAAISGTYLFVQDLMPLMRASGQADVLTIGSISGLPNAALQSASVPFYAAKRGQVALAEGLRQSFKAGPMRSILINPPYLQEMPPTPKNMDEATSPPKPETGTTKDVVEAALFALSRPRHVSMTIDLDADEGGLFPS